MEGPDRVDGMRRLEAGFLDDLAARGALKRLASKDHTLWGEDPTEIADRLGWLDCPADAEAKVSELTAFVGEVRSAGFTDAVVLGMGGSSLFPEVVARAVPGDGLRLHVIDTTDPAAVLRARDSLPLDRTLFIASSKSGSTIETRSQLSFFWDATGGAADRFCVITDPGSDLAAHAASLGFRRTWLADPTIGGRYSALSWFGLVPAALHGADVGGMLARAGAMMRACLDEESAAAHLAATLAAGRASGRDKLTMLLPGWASTFGAWLEQLVAESLGKHGVGIVPVTGEPVGGPEVYGTDRLFVSWEDDPSDLAAAGHPVVRLPLAGPEDIAAEVVRWEIAVALTGALMNINPFDQPNVAEAKAMTATMLRDGAPTIEPTPLRSLLAEIAPGDYLSIQAYIDPASPDLDRIERARARLRDRLRVATTVGVGPRFLHSTGQLHKGGPPSGVFAQIVGADPADAAIPGQPFGFSTLKHAQAAGDMQTLRAHGLRAARITLDDLIEEAG